MNLSHGPLPLAPADAAPRDRAPEERAVSLGRPFPKVTGYEVLSELGRGGMGVVYQARDVGLNRLVALKMILAANLTSAERMIRFMLEAELVACLHHPNIVQIYEVGQQDGVPYFALEYVDGGNLEEMLRRTQLTPAQAAALISQVARTVHHVHQHGIVHRDLKPANILLAGVRVSDSTAATSSTVTPDPWPLTPKITDFGVAKQMNAEMVVTDTGAVIGTPGYMAPEQACSAEKFGPAVDIHALGAILYELLAGRPPYKSATPAETTVRLLQSEPAPPRRYRRDVPRDLEIICLKCLEKDPAKRYASAAALADDLGRFLHGQPIVARAATTWERTIKSIRRRPAAAGLVAAVVAATVLAAACLGWGLSQRSHRLAAEQSLEVNRSSSALVFSPDAKLLAGTGPDDRLHVWDRAGKELAAWRWPSEMPAVLTFSDDGRLLAAGAGSTGVIRIFDVTTREELRGALGPERLTGLAFSLDQQTMAATDRSGRITILHLQSESELQRSQRD